MRRISNILTAIVLLWVMGLMLGQIKITGRGKAVGRATFGAHAQGNTFTCLGVNDSPAVQNAGNIGGEWSFPAGATCVIDASVTVSANNTIWHGNGATLKRLSTTADTTHYMLNITAANFQMDGFTYDVGGVLAGPDSSHYFLIADGGAGLKITNSTWLNSGTTQPLMNGLLAYQTDLELAWSTFQATILGGDVVHDGGTAGNAVASTVNIHDNTFLGTTFNGVFVENGLAGTSTSSGITTSIHDNTCRNITSSSGTGQNGNCVVVFQRQGTTKVSGQICSTLSYSCVRDNDSTGVIVTGNFCHFSNEVCFYTAEFGGEGVQVTGNIAADSMHGFGDTNIASKVLGLPGNFSGNTAYNIKGVCFHLENAIATGNSCSYAPIGIRVGFGGTGFGNLADNNTFSHVTVPIAVDQLLTATPNNIIGIVNFQNGNSTAQTANVQAMNTSAYLKVTAATNANPMQITYDASTNGGVNPSNTQVYLLAQFYGMTQANTSILCTVAAVDTTAHTFQCSGLNSTAYGTFATNPSTNIDPSAFLLFSSGTTPAFSIPSVLQQLVIP